MDLPEPTLTAFENWTASCVITGHIVAALRGEDNLRAADHTSFLREGTEDVWKRYLMWAEMALTETLAGAPVQVSHLLRRVTNMRAWPMVHLSTLNRTELSAY